jgi:thiamine-phosphate pyrophosphorylase
MKRKLDLSTYLITDRSLCGERGILEVVRRAIEGGVSLVQLRDPEAKTGELVAQARALLALLRPAGVPLIINDRVDVALAVAADGVHVGQRDMAPADVRALVGSELIVGLSISTLAELERSAGALAALDYLGVGPMFPTQTKPDAAPPIGAEGLAAVVARTQLPVVAIGGLKRENAAEAIGAGARGVAVVSEICCAADPAHATRELARVVREARASFGHDGH